MKTGISSGLRTAAHYISGNVTNIAVFVVCVILYYIVIARRFFGADVIGGDTQLAWSMHYFVMQSLIEYLQYPLWDPTTLGGYPTHLMMVNGWYQNFHPFQLPFLLAAAAVGRIFHIDSNYLMVFHKTIFLFSLNLVAVMLVTREICTTRLARVLPPLIYTLSYFQFFALRDNSMVEGLAPALFFVFGLLYHANRRSPYSLMVLLTFLALWIAGFCYPYLLSSAWWVGTLTVLIALFSPRLLTDSWHCARQLWARRIPRIQLLLVLALLVIAVGVVGFSVSTSIGEIIRASGAGPVDYDVSAGGQFSPRSIYSVEVWTNFLVWAPFPDLHTNFLKFDPWDAGVHHRYVGMVLLPLLVIAALFGHQHRYAWPFMLTAFVATAFIPYGPENPLFAFLLDNVPPIRNTRPLAYLLPRDATLLIMFAGGIGLDIILRRGDADTNASLWATARVILTILILIAGGLIVASAVPALASIRHSLAHMGVNLGLTSGIVLVLAHGIDMREQSALVLVLVAVTGMDLALSAAAYAKLTHTWAPHLPPQYISMPSPRLGPVKPGDPPWVGSTYRGQLHRLYGGPYVGTRSWLVLATHPSWQPVLQNWDAAGRFMKAYPDFRFFSNGAYVPFEAIRDIDKVKLPAYISAPPTRLIKEGAQELIRFPDRDVPIEKGFVGFLERTGASDNAVAFGGWALDEKSGRPAREVLVFVGDTLWGAIWTGIERPDLAGFGKAFIRSGFDGLLDGVPPAERKNIRVFALLGDETARELQYSVGYPFGTSFGPGPQQLQAPPVDGPPTFYLHDKDAVLPDVPGREEKLSWSVAKWTPNQYTVRVAAPSDGYLLNLENYNRDWKAYVDGKRQRILRANFTMQAIPLTKGEHVVEWRYDPLPFKLGWLAFYLVLAAVLTMFAFSGLRGPRCAGAVRN
jgi:Bacterial membrane protein YfhO